MTSPLGYALPGGVALLSLALCALIVATQRWHGRLTHDRQEGVQKSHAAPTPRVGGVAVVLALALAQPFLPAGPGGLLAPILLAALPAFGFGIAEDISKSMSVLARLLATLGSGLLAWYLTGIYLKHVAIGPMDLLLQWQPFALLMTALAIAGITNAINMIDGFNGLAGGSLAVMFGALGLLAQTNGDAALAGLCWLLAAAYLGFLVLNFPLGKIFMGDGGAYFGGFALAWVAILLPARNPAVSPWASLLVCSYPVMELLFSMLRRRRHEHQLGQPDRLHLHSLVHAWLLRRLRAARRPLLGNAAVAPLLWPFTIAPAVAAQFMWTERTPCALTALGLCVLYLILYARLIRLPVAAPAASLAPRLAAIEEGRPLACLDEQTGP